MSDASNIGFKSDVEGINSICGPETNPHVEMHSKQNSINNLIQKTSPSNAVHMKDHLTNKRPSLFQNQAQN